MKKAVLWGSLCLILTNFLLSCKKDNVTPETTDISSTHASALKAGTSKTDAYVTDDTWSLQSQLNAGNVTLIAGKTYNVTDLTVTHSLNLNGATLNFTNTGYGFALWVRGVGVSITNGTINGQWNSSLPGNPSGYGGIYVLANSCTISNMTLANFSSYGIVAGPVNGSKVTYCNISNTGYIGYFYDAESASTHGGVFSNNVIDRSMVPASTVMQMALGIRGSANNSSVTTTNWTITNNIIKMPVMPTSWTGACAEMRFCNNSYIANNVTTAGSMGLSIVACNGDVLENNTTSATKLEGIEFADCINCKTWNNKILSSYADGILIDGGTGSNGIQLNGDVISGTAQAGIHAYKKTTNLTISGCKLSLTAASPYGIELQQSSAVTILNTTMNGNGLGNTALELDNCPGGVTMTGGSVSNFKSCFINVYNSTTGLITDNLNVSGVTVTNVPKMLVQVLLNGGILGTNINLQL
jgi:hypothetical protein